MGKVNSFQCSNCQRTYIRWESPCRDCKGIDTIVEVATSVNRKSVRRRWQRVERETARDMLEADGPDPAYKNVASSTGKVGHITGMGFDAVSRTYTTEVKNKPLPKWLIVAWIQIQQKSIDLKKNALLHIKPPNLPMYFKVNGESFRSGTMAIMTQERHLELIKQVRVLSELELIISGDEKYKDLAEQLWILKRK